MVPLESLPPLSNNPIQFSSYSPTSIKGKALEQELNALVIKGAVEQAPLPSKGYYSLMFVVSKASGGWRPVIDLSHLNKYVLKTQFKMGTTRSVLFSIHENDDVLSRSQGCISSVPYSPSVSSSSQVLLGREGLAV